MVDGQLFLGVGVTLLVALAFGELLERLGEPAILGEILAGVILGGHVLGLIDPSGAFALLAGIGSMLLLFDAGYEEIDFGALKHGWRSVGLIALFGAGLPFLAGVGIGVAFGYSLVAAVVLAITLGVTSIGVSARTFIDLDRLDTRYGAHVVGAAVTAEIFGLLAFSVLVATQQAGTSPGRLLRTVGLVAAFFAVAALFGRFGTGRLSGLLARSRQKGADLVAIMGLLFLFGYGADAAGLDVIIGGLVAGLLISSEPRFAQLDVRDGIFGIAYGVFIPLFFANVGAQLDPGVLLIPDALILTVVAVGVLLKVGGSYLGARLAGHSTAEAGIVGAGMLPRAGVELVVITGALAAGIIDARLFSAVLALVFVSVFGTPLLLKRAIGRADRAGVGGR
ncbi:MAG: cation:proton antiporter [Halalkalicoccus sp.]|nr:cation:proton antiporter [Halalkalicoccus sp.]